MTTKIDVTSNAMWTNDCCGKQDLDFSIVHCYTRYWKDYSALCEIVFLHNFCLNANNGENYVKSDIEPITLIESGIMKGKSESDIKQKVKDWYNDNMIEAMEKALSVLKYGV